MGRGRDLSFQVVGRLSVLCDLIRPLAVRLRGGQRVSDGHDKTGIVQGERRVHLEHLPMEHTLHPEVWLKEISRLIRPGGVFMMTVPLLGFARHLARYFGRKESRRVNKEYHHYNLVEADRWLEWLRVFDFDPTVVLQYQSSSFSFWYRMLRLVGERGAGALPGVQDRLWKWSRPKMLKMISESVGGINDGANLFVVSR